MAAYTFCISKPIDVGYMLASNPSKLLFKDRAEFRSYHRNEEKSFAVLAILYGVVIAALSLVYSVKDATWAVAAPAYVFAFIVVGWVQYSIGNGLHEAVHYNLKNKKNDFWASLLTAYPVGLTISYREIHLQHHRYLGTAKDPEIDAYTHFPQSKIALILRFVWFASGVPALLQFVQQQEKASVSSGKVRWREPVGLVGTQLCILAPRSRPSVSSVRRRGSYASTAARRGTGWCERSTAI